MRSFVVLTLTGGLLLGGWVPTASADPVSQNTMATEAVASNLLQEARRTDRRGVVLARRIRHHLHLARVGNQSHQARALDALLSQMHSALRQFSSELQLITEIGPESSPQSRGRAETSLRLTRERFDRIQRQAENAIGGALEIPPFGA